MSKPPIEILQVTDLHYLPVAGEKMYDIDTEYYFRFVLQQAIKSHPQITLILVTGDLTQTPSPAGYQRIFIELDKTGIPVICLPGNHDDWSLMQKHLNAEKISCAKQTTLENWQIICLNSQKPGETGGALAEKELFFLDQELQKHSEKHCLVAVHHNILPMGSEWMDTMTIENSSQLLETLKNHSKVKTVIHGHTHQEREFKIDDMSILSTPSTCFQFKPRSKNFALEKASPGYRILNLYPEGEISSEVFRVEVK